MDLSPTRQTFQPLDHKQWLGSEHGTDCTETITLDIAGGSFDAFKIANGDGTFVIPSGIPVKRGTNPDLFVVATGAGNAAEGHLFEAVILRGGDTVGAPMLWHGVVIVAKVPGTFVNANRVASGLIRYRVAPTA